jgi:hypothetical protein
MLYGVARHAQAPHDQFIYAIFRLKDMNERENMGEKATSSSFIGVTTHCGV